ncbi:fungal-specific transcription factor domain-containing protein [Talaromyces proteolyticus]|uniref:Fungal-specific transcription factor domain-containing protein n=1 Tax=Talaromyces proteolyticus TaxID=1131652 RepID=A0AAD4Q5K4_9EURO|nr:fungal-specific transcription factor domain-containing protein [Talaromyces proteolyticus]KAH8704711.1 fungal-specific transcription factor domain-containing protein [Talaromyces proteolyticus]
MRTQKSSNAENGTDGESPSFPPTPDEHEMDNEDGDTSGSSKSGRVARRIACDACRRRKVRCDRAQPICGRCTKLNQDCKYTASRNQRGSDSNMSQALTTLQSRLAQAEARLASIHQPLPDMWNTASTIGLTLPPQNTTAQLPLDFPPTNTSSAFSSHMNFHHEPISLDSNGGHISENNNSNDNDWHEVFNDHSGSTFIDQIDMTDFEDESSHIIFLSLHQTYFNHIHAVIPMIDRHRFSLELDMSHPSPQLMSLSYAIALLGATVSSEHADFERTYYSHSRNYVETAERDDDDAQFNNLNLLQTYILLTYYEFRRKSFARAWMSLGKAIRLSDMLGLHRMDQGEQTGVESSRVVSFQGKISLTEARERRRTFWVLFAFDAYASIRTGSPLTIQEETISTRLPAASDSSKEPLVPNMPSLRNINLLYELTPISSFTGIVLMVSMHYRCRRHFQASQKQTRICDQHYDFWQHHYQLDKDLDSYATNLFGHIKPRIRPDDPLVFIVHMNLCAIKIELHEHAISKVRQQELPEMLIIESENQCRSAAVEVAEYAHLLEHIDPGNRTTFQQTNTFLMWPLAKASEVLSRHLRDPTKDVTQLTVLLERLQLTMQNLNDVSGHWDRVRNMISQHLAVIDSATG